MDYTLLAVGVIFALIVVGVGTYKHYKKKASLLKKKLDEANGETPEATPSAPVAGGSGGASKTTGVKQQAQ
jgi:hypothetical protein